MTSDTNTVKNDAGNSEERPSTDQPPQYDQLDEQPLTIPPLNLSCNPGSAVSTTVTGDQCVAHLKFLAALADLRDNIANTDGLFGLCEPSLSEFPEHVEEVHAQVREKRWAVYTARAVDRYAKWWKLCVPRSRSHLRVRDLRDESYNKITEPSQTTPWKRHLLPPLGK